MANIKRAKRASRFVLTPPRKFIGRPQTNISEKILKKLHLKSMVHW